MNNSPWLAHYDKGVPQTIDYPKAPLFYFLEEAARKYPDRACTIFKGAVISYREMNAQSDRMAAALVEMGVKKGDRVGIFMPNTPQFVIAYYGILKAGAAVVAINPTYPVDEIIMPVNDANIEIMFTLSRFYDKLKTARERSKLKKIIVSNLKEALPPFTSLLFTLLKEKKDGDRLSSLADGDARKICEFTQAEN
jgi:long-chain acyl-CoA synthetase